MNNKLRRLLRPDAGWFLVLLAVFSVVTMATGEYGAGLAELAVTAVLLLLYLLDNNRRKRKMKSFLQGMLRETDLAPETRPPFPAMLVHLSDERIYYVNDELAELIECTDIYRDRELQEILPGFSPDWLITGKSECPYDVSIGGKRYRVYGTLIRSEDGSGDHLGMLYFTDLTELYMVRDEYIRSRPVVAIIMVDNYEELVKNMTEGATSAMNAKLNEAITEWTEDYHGLLRRLERNRFLFVFERCDLKTAVEDKFSILERIHEVTSPAGVAASVSFGLGVDGANFEEGYSFASLALEMALSRGGDQAVVKDRFNFNFYGGRNKETDNRGKVRARVTANSLMELISQSSHVFIMGHRNADLDALGAAMGIGCMCRKKEKPFSIVLDMEHNACDRMLQEIMALPEYKNTFITGQDALVQCDATATLVVVDTNRPDQVEFAPLLEAIPKVCVVDHHRRAASYIDPVVNFHEIYASSASELTTELLQYAVETTDVRPVEAKALLAGIFLDTKSFNVRTGQRTFEAAAFLRRLGADTVEVKKLLQSDFEHTMEKYQIIKAARIYHGDIAISALNAATSRVLAAQAADEMLNISGISTSFVMYPVDKQVFISARSIGDVNVQMILEPLGGGGNAATAGAQMQNTTVAEALEQLTASIDGYFEN